MENLWKIAKEAVEEKKAVDPVVLDLNGISGVTDYFLICSGRTSVQVRSIIDNIVAKLQEKGIPLPQKEGYTEGRWVLLDCGDTVIHVMHETEREFYALEHLWHDAKVVAN